MDMGPDRYLEKRCAILMPSKKDLYALAKKVRKAMSDDEAEELNEGANLETEGYPAEFLCLKIALSTLPTFDGERPPDTNLEVMNCRAAIKRLNTALEVLEKQMEDSPQYYYLEHISEDAERIREAIQAQERWLFFLQPKGLNARERITLKDRDKVSRCCHMARKCALEVMKRATAGGRDVNIQLKRSFPERSVMLERLIQVAFDMSEHDKQVSSILERYAKAYSPSRDKGNA